MIYEYNPFVSCKLSQNGYIECKKRKLIVSNIRSELYGLIPVTSSFMDHCKSELENAKKILKIQRW